MFLKQKKSCNVQVEVMLIPSLLPCSLPTGACFCMQLLATESNSLQGMGKIQVFGKHTHHSFRAGTHTHTHTHTQRDKIHVCMYSLLYFRSTVNKFMIPKVVGLVLDQLNKSDKQSPWMWSIYNQPLKENPSINDKHTL